VTVLTLSPGCDFRANKQVEKTLLTAWKQWKKKTGEKKTYLKHLHSVRMADYDKLISTKFSHLLKSDGR
jgi:hypothetical protein